MQPGDISEFVRVLGTVAEVFNEPVSRERAAMYFGALSDHPLDLVRTAMLATLRTSKFFPRPAEILERITGDPETRAMVAFTRFQQAIQNVGPDSPVAFGDAATHATIQALGGWREVNLWTALPVEQQGYLGVQWRKLYLHFCEHPRADTPTVLNDEPQALNPIRRIDPIGLPEAVPAKALTVGEPTLAPEEGQARLKGLIEQIGKAMGRADAMPQQRRAARALGPGEKPLTDPPTEEEKAEHERRREQALRRFRAVREPGAPDE